MTSQPGDLGDVQGVTDPETVVQNNTEVIARMLWKREPTYVAGVPNAITGPPTTLPRFLNELWIDQTGAKWKCTVAGTPGTWVKIEPTMLFGVKTAHDFASIAAGASASTTLTITMATSGDVVLLGFSSAPEAGLIWDAYVSAANTITIRATNVTAGAIDPASRNYNVVVICG